MSLRDPLVYGHLTERCITLYSACILFAFPTYHLLVTIDIKLFLLIFAPCFPIPIPLILTTSAFFHLTIMLLIVISRVAYVYNNETYLYHFLPIVEKHGSRVAPVKLLISYTAQRLVGRPKSLSFCKITLAREEVNVMNSRKGWAYYM